MNRISGTDEIHFCLDALDNSIKFILVKLFIEYRYDLIFATIFEDFLFEHWFQFWIVLSQTGLSHRQLFQPFRIFAFSWISYDNCEKIQFEQIKLYWYWFTALKLGENHEVIIFTIRDSIKTSQAHNQNKF